MDDRNYRFTSSFVNALAGLGVRHAAVSPGSRNTPLSMTLAAEPRLTDWPILDERSAGFFALGAAKASGRPAVVTCTSGTAAAELHPAVVEARYGRVPMIVVTADRPSDVWEAGAAQTIDQRAIYGSAVWWSHDLDVPAPGDAAPGLPAALAARLVAESMRNRGPVHLNLRFREPLVPVAGIPGPEGPVPEIHLGTTAPDKDAVGALVSDVGGSRGIMVVGPSGDPLLAPAAAAAAAALGWPILADPQSGLLAGPHDRSRVAAAGYALLEAGILDRLVPEVVLRVGAPCVSKPLAQWLAAHPEITQIHLDDDGWRDPGFSVRRAVRADAAATLQMLAAARPRPAQASWASDWRSSDAAAAQAVADTVGDLPFPTDPGIAAAVGNSVPDGALLYVASSMPIRDLALTFGTTERAVRIASNRGANGIDGFLSSALGAAAAWDGPVIALGGDLSAVHDLTSLAAAARLGLPITYVLVDNDGGGIFHFLPQAGHPEVFERHFGAPQGVDLVGAASSLGVPTSLASGYDEVREAASAAPDGPTVLVVRTDRHANVEVHRRIAEAAGKVPAG